MADLVFNFSSLADYHLNVLNPNDLNLFYYDISLDVYSGCSSSYSWSKDVEDYLSSKGVIVEGGENYDVPSYFEDNKIYFSMIDEDNSNKAAAFYRHLRNSFAHYNIGRGGSYFFMKDYLKDGVSLSMIGKIDVKLFEGLISIFFGQKENTEKDYNAIDEC